MIRYETTFLVIGSGIAGLTAALRLSELGQVMVVTKRRASMSNSSWAQGGIACVMNEQDSFDSHVRDTLNAGGGLCDENIARRIIEEAPDAIADLIRFGVSFDENGKGYDLGKEGGHAHRRVLHSGDITGSEIISVLLKQIRLHPKIRILEECFAIDLVTSGWLKKKPRSACMGAYFYDEQAGDVFAVKAAHTIIATGGAGKAYLYTTNPDVASGDGVAMAWRAGLPIKNMEFVQFHPTCLYHPEAKNFLISEAVRGEGGVLINEKGERFVKDLDQRGSLAPRDIVARAIDMELKQSGAPCVYLDITHKSESFLKERFPNIHARCLQLGIDMARQPIPVVPAAHYFCGGVEASVSGKTRMPRLHVIGEAACTGFHGANRLASNSLLEGMIMGKKLAKRLAKKKKYKLAPQAIPDWETYGARPSEEAVVVEHDWNEVRTTLWNFVGIVRTDKRLFRAARRIRTLRREIEQYYKEYLISSDVLELRNIAAISELVIRSALERKESRGLHYTLDYPQTLDEAKDTLLMDDPVKARQELLGG